MRNRIIILSVAVTVGLGILLSGCGTDLPEETATQSQRYVYQGEEVT